MFNSHIRVNEVKAKALKGDIVSSDQFLIHGRIGRFSCVSRTDTKIQCRFYIDEKEAEFLGSKLDPIGTADDYIFHDGVKGEFYVNLTVKHRTKFIGDKTGDLLENAVAKEYDRNFRITDANLRGLEEIMNSYYANREAMVKLRIHVFKRRCQKQIVDASIVPDTVRVKGLKKRIDPRSPPDKPDCCVDYYNWGDPNGDPNGIALDV